MKFYSLFKNIAFKCDPEKVHDLTLSLCQKFPFFADTFYSANDEDALKEKYSLDIAGMKWTFPIGLAAGLDKNARAIDFFSRLLFGAIEVGTITPKPQLGNDKPRLFRHPEEESLRNAMGFNNEGIDELLKNINSTKIKKPLGINIGKNKTTTEENALKDYEILFQKTKDEGDYIVVNISSPNTPGLRDLQSEEFIRDVLQIYRANNCTKPIFVKVAPDMEDKPFKELITSIIDNKASGVIATNTTIRPDWGIGGVSGKALLAKSKAKRNLALEISKNTAFEVIGVGGISSFADLLEFWQAGGKVAQIYTSFIYQGPQILSDIKTEIDSLLEKRQCSNLQELLEGFS